MLETVGRAVKAGADFATQHRSIWPDGTVRWLSGAGRVHLGEHGKPMRALGVTLDVTERRTLRINVGMPGASGPELTRRLVERRPALKVIYMSGYSEDAIAHHGVLDAGIAFLHKRFTFETLERKIREVLDR